MEIKSLSEELTRLKLSEEIRTVEFLQSAIDRHNYILDLSNHYIFDTAATAISKFLVTHYTKVNRIKTFILQNCMLEGEILTKILDPLRRLNKKLALRELDFSNNRLTLTEDISLLINKVMYKGSSNKLRRLVLQGNILLNPDAIGQLFVKKFPFQELNLYDTNLSAEALLVLSDMIGDNAYIQKLDLGFNSEAFLDARVVTHFAQSVAKNTHMETLKLNGNQALSETSLLQALCENISSNNNLIELSLAGIEFGDEGIEVICENLLQDLPICALDLQNNQITSVGICRLMDDLPELLSNLDISYNAINDASALLSISYHLMHSRSLRKLNISHSIELESLPHDTIDELAEAIAQNDSLSELTCEGVKLGDDPDYFCKRLGEAISVRRLSLTFKISAVNCFNSESSIESSAMIKNISGRYSPQKLISEVPSNISPVTVQDDSTLQTERRNVQAEATSMTAREYCFDSFSSSFISKQKIKIQQHFCIWLTIVKLCQAWFIL